MLTRPLNPGRTVPLGDQAALVCLETEFSARLLAVQLRAARWPWLIDVVQAYSSVGVHFDAQIVDFSAVAERIETLESAAEAAMDPAPCHRIPCCYELGLDLDAVSTHTGLDVETVIRTHSETVYTVYAIGFCPGFPYLGYLPPELSGVPRLPSPRVRVEVGSVGLTGRQTGIYTEPRPGGWHLLGRTPLQLVNVADGYFPLRTGDSVKFERIDRAAFNRLLGQRLTDPSR